MFYLQSRWKLENNVLRYYGLRNKPYMFKNTVKLTRAQRAVVSALPCELSERQLKTVDNPEGFNDDFEVNIIRGAEYAGINAQGAYVYGEEAINLYIDKFDIYALTVLCHEFFHHFQQVLCYGVGDETWETVPCDNHIYFYNTCLTHVPPCIVVANDEKWKYYYDF